MPVPSHSEVYHNTTSTPNKENIPVPPIEEILKELDLPVVVNEDTCSMSMEQQYLDHSKVVQIRNKVDQDQTLLQNYQQKSSVLKNKSPLMFKGSLRKRSWIQKELTSLK